VIYFYAIVKDYAGGAKVRENTWYSPLQTQPGGGRGGGRGGGARPGGAQAGSQFTEEDRSL
jgi:hypothetical protein